MSDDGARSVLITGASSGAGEAIRADLGPASTPVAINVGEPPAHPR